jgi:hypothetical protein
MMEKRFNKEMPEIVVGEKYVLLNGDHVRIMAFTEGYYMARRKGCMPFVKHEKEMIDWMRKWCE